MFTPERIAIALGAVAILAACATQQTAQPLPAGRPNLGVAATPEELKTWDISIPPSGEGLPAGSGTVKQGLAVYTAKCQACHGERGAGKPADALAGGIGSLSTDKPVRTVGSYWPYATTLWDYTRRAMPVSAPMSLTNDEVYAVTAYVLHVNGIVGEDATMNAQTLPAVKMPNRDGFISDWPPRRR
ncbi:MAG TPA: cytochrome c [Burkholderiales bacterium]|nr:cytochrome c [Burkholderiales bacterium]